MDCLYFVSIFSEPEKHPVPWHS